MSSKVDSLPFHKQLIAGAVAGSTECLVMYPLDIVKTRMQLVSGANTPSMVSIFKDIVKKEGFSRLYRGLLPPLMAEAPKRAVKFSSNDTYQKLFSQGGKVTQLSSTLAGIGSGLTEAVVICPFEVVKIKLQAAGSDKLYKNTNDAFLKIIKTEGPGKLFLGIEATLWRHGVWNGVYFSIIHFIRGLMPSSSSKGAQTFTNFCAGTLAGAAASACNTPFDVAKSRIQGGVPGYQWAVPAVMKIASEEGPRALWKGFVPKVVRLGPGGGILLVVFDFMKDFLRDV